jgi:hypothetical protein
MTTANTVVMPSLLRRRARHADQAARGADDAAEARGAKGVTSHGEGTEQDLEQQGPNGEERRNILLPA